MFPINSAHSLRLCPPLRNERVGIPLAICRESGLNLGANASFSQHPPFVVVQDDDDDGDDDDQHKDNSLKRRLAGKASGGKAPLREWETVPPGPEPEFSWRSAVKLFGSRQTAPSQKKAGGRFGFAAAWKTTGYLHDSCCNGFEHFDRRLEE